MKLDERTKNQVYAPVFVLFGLTFLLIVFLLGKRLMNRGSSTPPRWSEPYEKPEEVKGKDGGGGMPAALPAMRVDKVERRRYRRRPSQTLRRPPAPTAN